MAARFPEIRWSVTAGNASQVTDGASAILIAEESVAAAPWPQAPCGDHALRACRRRSGHDADGYHPGDEEASRRAGLSLDRIDSFEVNEAFASVVLAWSRTPGRIRLASTRGAAR